MRRVFQRVAALVLAFAAFLCIPFQGYAGTLTLGSAQSFAVLGASAVTNTGSTTITGDYGVSPGTSIGVAGITLTGTVHATDGVALQAQSDVAAAYSAIVAMLYTSNLSGKVLGTDVGTAGTPLTPGVYFFSTEAQLTGALFLDFSSNPGGNFIFQIGTTLTTASASSVTVTGGSSLSGIYWQVGSSATLGTSSTIEGNVLANQSITMTTSAKILCGRAFAQVAAVTMDGNTVSDTCPVGGSPTDFGSLGFSGGPAAPGGVPEPLTLTLSGLGLFAGSLLLRKFRRR